MLYITVLLLLLLSPAAYYANASRSLPTGSEEYVRAPYYQNSNKCGTTVVSDHHSPGCQCDPSFIHVAMTLDSVYLRGSVAAVNSILKHTACPRSIYFHFLAAAKSGSGVSSEPDQLRRILKATFPYLAFRVYPFAEQRVKRLISSSVRQALDSPLNYARTYLADIINPCVERIIYLDSDLVLVDDIQKLWSIKLGDSKVIGAPQYCHANFTRYFTDEFWSDPELNKNFEGKQPCYFNTGVMVMELQRWRKGGFTKKIENWMKIQKERRIYELGSLPPFLLVFGGNIEPIHHRWNQHGLGGDNLVNSCRSLHPGPVSLLHWSGKGKPWVRLDQGTMCPVDHLWAPYDLHRNRLRPQ